MVSDIFISYRRDGGEVLAQLLYYTLRNEGYNVFLDVETLGSGEFNQQLYDKIRECKDFILVLPPKALDRCKNENDWVRLEIECALESGKKIIPIMMKGFENWPDDLPESIQKVSYYNGLKYYHGYFKELINKLKEPRFLISTPGKRISYSHESLLYEQISETEEENGPKPWENCPICGSGDISWNDTLGNYFTALSGYFKTVQYSTLIPGILMLGYLLVGAILWLLLKIPACAESIPAFVLSLFPERYGITLDTLWDNISVHIWAMVFASCIPYLCGRKVYRFQENLHLRDTARGQRRVTCKCSHCGSKTQVKIPLRYLDSDPEDEIIEKAFHFGAVALAIIAQIVIIWNFLAYFIKPEARGIVPFVAIFTAFETTGIFLLRKINIHLDLLPKCRDLYDALIHYFYLNPDYDLEFEEETDEEEQITEEEQTENT